MSKSKIFRCGTCGTTVSVSEEAIKMITTGIEFILKTPDINDRHKIAYLSDHEVGTNFGRVILPETEIIEVILNQILICGADRNWEEVPQVPKEEKTLCKRDVIIGHTKKEWKAAKEIKPHTGEALCKCGHIISVVGTKWQHIDEIDEDDKRAEFFGRQINTCMGYGKFRKYRETCYHCACIDPLPAEEKP
ncbi:MAG: hypothetical protein PHZ02_01365 [Desulfocapsaceae bacterium]|nr:hypothetical protein [Desulfocapsaceae bacterium]